MKNVLFIVGSMREQSFNGELAKVAEDRDALFFCCSTFFLGSQG